MSGATKADVYKLMGFIQDDLRQTQAKLIEVRSMLAAGAMSRERTPDFACSKCGAARLTVRDLAFHMQNVHDGPAVPLTPEEDRA
jgi:hypothetical protein